MGFFSRDSLLANVMMSGPIVRQRAVIVTKRDDDSTKIEVKPSVTGAVAGAAAGAKVAGPPGAIVGGILGGVLGPAD